MGKDVSIYLSLKPNLVLLAAVAAGSNFPQAISSTIVYEQKFFHYIDWRRKVKEDEKYLRHIQSVSPNDISPDHWRTAIFLLSSLGDLSSKIVSKHQSGSMPNLLFTYY